MLGKSFEFQKKTNINFFSASYFRCTFKCEMGQVKLASSWILPSQLSFKPLGSFQQSADEKTIGNVLFINNLLLLQALYDNVNPVPLDTLFYLYLFSDSSNSFIKEKHQIEVVGC